MGADLRRKRLVGAGVSEAVGRAAEIRIEVLGPRGPVAAEPAEQVELVLDAGSGRPSGLGVLAREGAGLHADEGFVDVLLHLTIRKADGGVEEGRADRVAAACAHRGKPRHLLIDARGGGRATKERTSEISAPQLALQVGIDTANEPTGLPVVANDAAAEI